MAEAADKTLTCVDCGAQFTFTARDQAFYQERGYSAPRRCRDCRDKRKSASGGVPTMKDRGSHGHSDATAGAPAAAGGPSSFKVQCSGCGVETTVPFKPDPTRPVYCRTCYLSRRKT